MMENQPQGRACVSKSAKASAGAISRSACSAPSGRFFRPGYHNNLVASWLPALDGVAAKLERGASVADVGCGHGFSTVIMAKAFPKSTFVGYDFHPDSVEQARVHAEQHGVSGEHEVRSRHGAAISRARISTS